MSKERQLGFAEFGRSMTKKKTTRGQFLSMMLRIHFLQQWYTLSDARMEDELIDVPVLRSFVGIDLLQGKVPDETTILTFRHLLEEKKLAKPIFQVVNQCLEDQSLLMRKGTIVDATIIHAPSSTKNQKKQRDPEMHQTRIQA